MKKYYLLLLALGFGVIACTPTQEVVEKKTEEVVEEKIMDSSDDDDEKLAYKTVVLKGDIPSPRKEMRAFITVNYGSPSVKGRTVWGDLVPYGKVWRTGANEATTFETRANLKVQGQALPPGKYSLFTIPSKDDNWTVIFNSEANQWGAYKYNEEKDVLRVNAEAEMRNSTSETMEFIMEGNNLVLLWDKLALPIKIEK